MQQRQWIWTAPAPLSQVREGRGGLDSNIQLFWLQVCFQFLQNAADDTRHCVSCAARHLSHPLCGVRKGCSLSMEASEHAALSFSQRRESSCLAGHLGQPVLKCHQQTFVAGTGRIFLLASKLRSACGGVARSSVAAFGVIAIRPAA